MDAAGDVWVTGWTRSANFPVTAGAIQRAQGERVHDRQEGQRDRQILNATRSWSSWTRPGATEKYGTYWGGSEDDFGMGIGLDGSGDVIVAGSFRAPGRTPRPPGRTQTSGGGFLLKFHP